MKRAKIAGHQLQVYFLQLFVSVLFIIFLMCMYYHVLILCNLFLVVYISTAMCSLVLKETTPKVICMRALWCLASQNVEGKHMSELVRINFLFPYLLCECIHCHETCFLVILKEAQVWVDKSVPCSHWVGLHLLIHVLWDRVQRSFVHTLNGHVKCLMSTCAHTFNLGSGTQSIDLSVHWCTMKHATAK